MKLLVKNDFFIIYLDSNLQKCNIVFLCNNNILWFSETSNYWKDSEGKDSDTRAFYARWPISSSGKFENSQNLTKKYLILKWNAYFLKLSKKLSYLPNQSLYLFKIVTDSKNISVDKLLYRSLFEFNLL